MQLYGPKVDTVSQQRGRLHRLATLGAGIFMHLIVCWTILSIGYMSIEPLQFMGLSSLAGAGFVIFSIAILMEWNLGLEDPDMSLAQMMWAVSIIIMTAYFAIEFKSVVVLSGLALIVMGANRLTRKELIIFSIYSLVTYALSVVYKAQFDSLALITEIVVMVAFGLVLVFGPVLYRFEMAMVENALLDKNEELSKALIRIRELATKDELTGAYNRRHLMEFVAQQKAMADRRDYRFTLCYVDLDFFKRVNDRFGHSAGDHVLRSFSEIARVILREVDCVARVGGEEFVLVLSGTPQQDAVIAVSRIAQKLGELQVSDIEPQYRITACIGITEYKAGEEVGQTLDRADRALYDAKRTGRNKIVMAEVDGAQGYGIEKKKPITELLG